MPATSIYEIKEMLDHRRTFNEAEIRALCRASYVGGTRSLCRVLGRYRMLVDTKDIGISSHLMLDGFWEMWVTEAMLGCVRRGSTVIDVGAGLGYYSLLLAELAGPDGSLIAFEPNPMLAECARENIAINGFANRATVHQCALGAAEDTAMLHWERRHPGAGAVRDWTEGGDPVAVRRLDSFPEAIDAEFVIIDVQGYEQQVWRGMTRILANGQPITIFMRFCVGRYFDSHGFLDEITGEGFTLEIVDSIDGIRATSIEEIMAHPHNIDHMLCFRR